MGGGAGGGAAVVRAPGPVRPRQALAARTTRRTPRFAVRMATGERRGAALLRAGAEVTRDGSVSLTLDEESYPKPTWPRKWQSVEPAFQASLPSGYDRGPRS